MSKTHFERVNNLMNNITQNMITLDNQLSELEELIKYAKKHTNKLPNNIISLTSQQSIIEISNLIGNMNINKMHQSNNNKAKSNNMIGRQSNMNVDQNNQNNNNTPGTEPLNYCEPSCYSESCTLHGDTNAQCSNEYYCNIIIIIIL